MPRKAPITNEQRAAILDAWMDDATLTPAQMQQVSGCSQEQVYQFRYNNRQKIQKYFDGKLTRSAVLDFNFRSAENKPEVMDDTIAVLMADNADLKRQVDALRQMHDDDSLELKAKDDALDAMRSLDPDGDTLAKLAAAEEMLKEREDDCRKLTDCIDDIAEDFDELARTEHEQRKRAEAAENKLELLKNENDLMRTKLEDAHKCVNDYRQLYERTRDKLQDVLKLIALDTIDELEEKFAEE